MYRRLSTGLVCACLHACGGEAGPNEVEIGSIQVVPNPITLAQQTSVALEVAVLNNAGVLLSGVPVSFASADSTMITVSNVGRVQSVGPAGSSEVRVRAADFSVNVPVTITATGNTIRVPPSTVVVPQGQSRQVDVVLLDLVGAPIPGAAFVYTSSNASVATVDAFGLVTAHGPAGDASITVTTGSLSTQFQVRVSQVPTSIQLLPNPIAIVTNSALTVTAKVLDAVGTHIASSVVTLAASPTSLLTISPSGILRAGTAPGAGSVVATSGTLSQTASVTIIEASALEGTLVATAPAAGAPYGVVLTSDGTMYGVGINGVLHVGAFAISEIGSHTISGPVTIGLSLNPASGRLYAGGSGNDAVMEIDPATKLVTRRWGIAGEQIYDVAVSPDGQVVYAAGAGGVVHTVSTSTMTGIAEFPTGMAIVHLTTSPGQPFIYASGSGRIREINLENGAQRTFMLPEAQATALALAGDRLFIGGEDGQLGIVTLSTGVMTTTVVPECRVYDVVATPDGRELLVTCPLSGKAMLLDATTLVTRVTIPTTGLPRRAAISSDGTKAVIANEFGWYSFIR